MRLGLHDLANLVGKEDPVDLHFLFHRDAIYSSKTRAAGDQSIPSGNAIPLVMTCKYVDFDTF